MSDLERISSWISFLSHIHIWNNNYSNISKNSHAMLKILEAYFRILVNFEIEWMVFKVKHFHYIVVWDYGICFLVGFFPPPYAVVWSRLEIHMAWQRKSDELDRARYYLPTFVGLAVLILNNAEVLLILDVNFSFYFWLNFSY